MNDKTGGFPLLLVSGLSGAGKSTALNVFEDLRFFSVDHPPASLVPKLVTLFQNENQRYYRGLALGMDPRGQDYLGEWRAVLNELETMGVSPQIIFIEAKSDVLMRRYATTRRPHPMSYQGEKELGLEQAIDQERAFLAPLRKMAAMVIDTTNYSVHDLRRKIQEQWTSFEGGPHGLRVYIISFGFKYGVPTEADLVFDLRFLPNPHFVEDLRPYSGKDKSVADYVLKNDPGKEFMDKFSDFLLYLLPLFEQEGRYRLTAAVGCTGGRHRSVAVAEALAGALKESDYSVSLEHRHLELG